MGALYTVSGLAMIMHARHGAAVLPCCDRGRPRHVNNRVEKKERQEESERCTYPIAGIDIGEGGSKGVAAVLLRRPCHCVLAKHAANGIMPALFPGNGVAEAHGADDG